MAIAPSTQPGFGTMEVVPIKSSKIDTLRSSTDTTCHPARDCTQASLGFSAASAPGRKCWNSLVPTKVWTPNASRQSPPAMMGSVMVGRFSLEFWSEPF